MKKILRAVYFLLFLQLPNSALAQLIKEEFPVQVFEDQFESDKDVWRNMSTSDNLFVIQDGEYLLRRKNLSSDYSVFPNWENKLAAFSLKASLKLEDSKNPDASIGLIFMAQEDASGAFIFEFNSKGHYRLKQLVGLSFKPITGDAKSGGWVASDALNPLGQYNIIEVRTARRNYDIYANEKYLLSFTEIAYKSGNIGFSIGASTKARVDFIIVKEPKSEDEKNTSQVTGSPGHSGTKTGGKQGSGSEANSGSVTGTSDVILNLVEQVSNLKVENQALRDSVRLLKRQLKNATSTKPNVVQEPK